MTGIVGRMLRGRDGAGHHDNENQNSNTPRTAATSRKSKTKRRHPPPSGGKRTPVVIPPWSYSLREVKEKVRKRDGMRRMRVDEDELAMGDVEGVWKGASADAASTASWRFLPTAREEERLDRIFESCGAGEGPGDEQNIPFGRGSYRAKKSMGERRWEAHVKQNVQNGIDHVETLEERFGKRFIRECRNRVYGCVGGDGRRTGTGKQAQVEERNEADPLRAQGRPRRRLNVGVPVGCTAQKRPSTADASIKRSRVEAAKGRGDGGDGGWRIVAGRPSSH
jgi:hypothetical protein